MVELITVAAAVVGILVLLIVGDIAFKRVYGVPEPADEEHTVVTDDSLNISLWRHKPKIADGGDGEDSGEDSDSTAGGNGEPVLLIHGISVGHRNMNFDDENGVAQYLAENGYDCWAIDLRGRGGSEIPGSPWSFDDYVEHDMPAAIDYILDKTDSDGVHCVGHSLGGMLIYATAGTQGYDDKMKSAVSLGAPVYFYNQPFLHYISRIGLGISPILRRMKRLHLLPYTARIASVFLPIWPNGIVIWLANKRNTDSRTLRRASTCVVARLCPRILHNFADWIVYERWTSEDNETDYHDGTRSVETPTLVVAGNADTLCPRRDVKPGYRMLASEDKEYIVAGEDMETEEDYAHADLVFGKNARDELFPKMKDWIDEHNG